MTTIVTRAGKGSPLTHTEVDTNFTNLNTNKLEAGAIALGSAATPSISFTGDLNTGIYSPGADQLAVATNGNARLYIASDGKVGIGTTGPDYNLQVAGTNPTIAINATNSSASSVSTLLYRNVDGNGNTRNIASIEGESTSNGGYGALAFHTAFNNSLNERFRCDAEGRLLVGTTNTIAGATDSLLQIRGNSSGTQFAGKVALATEVAVASIVTGTDLGAIYFGNTANGVGGLIECKGDAQWSTAGGGDYPGRLVFSTTADGAASPTERMRITNDGTVQVDGRNGSASDNYYSILPSPGTSRNHFLANTISVGTFALQGNGTSTFTSDERRKKNIETTRDGYLEDLNKLRVVKYNWKALPDDSEKELGLIAQEVEKVFPGLIAEYLDPDENLTYKALKGSVLPFMLLKALQEASAKIENLEARLTAAGIE